MCVSIAMLKGIREREFKTHEKKSLFLQFDFKILAYTFKYIIFHMKQHRYIHIHNKHFITYGNKRY